MSPRTARPVGQDGSDQGDGGGEPADNVEILAREHATLQRACTPDLFVVDGHKPEIVYPYVGVDGHPVAVMARFAPNTLKPDTKTFRPFRYERGKWVLGVGKLEIPLYRAAEVLNALRSSTTIWIVEGEKCADVLHANGLVATTNAFGAEKWLPHHTEMLRGARAVVMGDNDEPGLRHVHLVAHSLRASAESLKVLKLPGVEEREPEDGWDVADWLEDGGTAEVLSESAGSAPEWTPPAETASGWPEPVPFRASADAEPFPIETALTSHLAEFACAVAESVKVDVTGPAALVSVVLSVAAGNAYRVRVSDSYCEPNLSRYVVWGKASGERGSETFRRVIEPLEGWMDDEFPRYEREVAAARANGLFYRKLAEGLETRAARQKSPAEIETLRRQAEEARTKIPPLPRSPLLYIGDTTSEALVRSMYAQGGSLGVLCADARHVADELLGRYRRDGKTDDSVYLRAHGGDPIDRGRVGSTSEGEYIRISRPALGLGICVQPDKLRELAERPELLSSGFLPRCNLILPQSLIGQRLESEHDRAMDPDQVQRWARIVRAIVNARFNAMAGSSSADWDAIELALSPEAMILRRAFANELERRQRRDGDLHEVAAFASKCAGEAARLAGLLHLAEYAAAQQLSSADQLPISAETWRIAEAHQRWQLAETLRVLSLCREDELTGQARRVLDWCARKPAERRIVSQRDVISSRVVEDNDGATTLMTWLTERGWARPVAPAANTKQRTPRWELNPLVFREVAR